jgi:hypothetical protein
MKISACIAASVLLLQQGGCYESKPSTPPAVVSPKPVYSQRFLPVPSPQTGMFGVPWTGYFALDTQTGQLCRTWDWGYIGNGKKVNDLDQLPTCLSLYSP